MRNQLETNGMPTSISSKNIPQHVKRLSQNRETPFLAIDKNKVQRKYSQFTAAMPDAKVFYAVKTNSDKRIVNMLHNAGSGFEISSKYELDLLLGCGVPGSKIISSNPLKSTSFIQAAHAARVNYFAFDSQDEIAKLSEYAPGSKVYIRLTVSNEGSQWPLSGKFGVETDVAVDLLINASRYNLVPCGITFHVGSQCTDTNSWGNAIKKSKMVWEMVKAQGIELTMLNIGGGFPVEYVNSIPSVGKIATAVKKSLKNEFPNGVDVFTEPGRTFVGESGTMVSTVIAKAKRNGNKWLYLDVGVFNGMMESIGGIEYSMHTEKTGPLQKWIVAGPSCDSMDVISNEVELPELNMGDKVYIASAGAYTTAYASRFNGFPIPKTYIY